MNRSPSGWLPTLVLLAALAGAAGAEAGAVRGVYRPSDYGIRGSAGCILPSDVPRFHAVALHAPTAAHAESLLARLGFAFARRDGRDWRVAVRLGDRGDQLVWRDADRDPSFGARGVTAPVPLQTVEFVPPDPELPLAVAPPEPPTVGPNPNGVAGLAYVIGVVESIDQTAERWPPAHTRGGGGTVPLLDFRSRFGVPALGARASDAQGGGFGGGAVRLLEPYGPAGFASERLRDGHAGWVGFGLSAPHPEQTAAWFDAHGVRYTRDAVAGRLMLRLDPAETDGLLVEVVGPRLTPTP